MIAQFVVRSMRSRQPVIRATRPVKMCHDCDELGRVLEHQRLRVEPPLPDSLLFQAYQSASSRQLITIFKCVSNRLQNAGINCGRQSFRTPPNRAKARSMQPQKLRSLIPPPLGRKDPPACIDPQQVSVIGLGLLRRRGFNLHSAAARRRGWITFGPEASDAATGTDQPAFQRSPEKWRPRMCGSPLHPPKDLLAEHFTSSLVSTAAAPGH